METIEALGVALNNYKVPFSFFFSQLSVHVIVVVKLVTFQTLSCWDFFISESHKHSFLKASVLLLQVFALVVAKFINTFSPLCRAG